MRHGIGCLLILPVIALGFDDADMESADRGPWNIYGTPSVIEKSDFARSGLRSLRVVTDNRETMGGNYEGTSQSLGKFEPGDLIRVSFWYWVRGGRDIVVGMGPGQFQTRQVMTGTDWTRAEIPLRVTKAGHHSIWISQADDATEFFLDDFAVDVVRRPQLGTAEAASRAVLSRGPLRLALCRETGALCGIENMATGESYAQVGRRQPLFGIELLATDGMGHEAIPFERMRLARFDMTGPWTATMHFETDGLPIKVIAEVTMQEDGSARFTGELKNDSARKVMSFEMPMIFGVCPARDPAQLTLVHPEVCGQIVTNATRSAGCQTTFPGRGVMGWMDLSGERGGIYLASIDQGLTGTRLMALPAPGPTFDMSLTREIVVRPGETWVYPGAVLAVHEGDWHAAADRYRSWARGWMKRPDVPRWMQDANGWVLMGIQNGVPFWRIPDVYREAQWMGIEYLHVQGEGIDNMWFDADGKRQSHTMTYLHPSPRFGTVDELKAAVRKIHQNDGHVMFYFLYERWTPSHCTSDDFGTGKRADVPQAYRPPGIEFYNDSALLDRPGQRLPAEHPFMAIRNMCLAAPGWQDWMRRWAIDVYAREYGADGFYWDVMGRNGPFRCFNARHGHEGDNGWARGCATVLESVIRQGREINPDYSCAIEGSSDHLGQWVGFHLMSGATQSPNVFRYTFPEYLCVDGLSNHYWKWTQVEKARRVFLDGERFDIHGYQQQIKKIIDLRRRIKPFVDWPAVFRDTVGLRISDPRVQARAFVRTDGENRTIAVTMMNEGGVDGATVEVDLVPLGQPRAAHLFHLDGRVAPLRSTRAIPVPKDAISAAVIVVALSPELRAHAWLEQEMMPGEDGATLTLYMPLGAPKDLTRRVTWPNGYAVEESVKSDESRGLGRVAFRDAANLRTLKRWMKVEADVRWTGGQTSAWCVLAPPLVNGDCEDVEDGRLISWGVPPCMDSPGQGNSCIRLDKDTTPNGHITQRAPLKPNTKYRFRCMIRNAGNRRGAAHIVEYEGGLQREHKFVRSATLASTKSGQWETLETVFTSHPDPSATGVYLYSNDRENVVWFDGIALEEIDSP